MYYIRIKHYYYNNTLLAPKDGPWLDGDMILTFSSRSEAKEYLFKHNINQHVKGHTYTSSGITYLNHGEYAAPDYQIRKTYTHK